MIAAERRRQIEQEGWSPEHDDLHDKGELARAAAIYALIAGGNTTLYRNALDGYRFEDAAQIAFDAYWPFEQSWFKPTDRIRDLEKAGALIAAEIDRLLRAALAGSAEVTPKGNK